MKFTRFPDKSKATKVSVLAVILVVVALITFFVVDLVLDFLNEEYIRSEIEEEINKYPEICEEFANIEKCIDNLMKEILESQ